jgi:hypothetical protein
MERNPSAAPIKLEPFPGHIGPIKETEDDQEAGVIRNPIPGRNLFPYLYEKFLTPGLRRIGDSNLESGPKRQQFSHQFGQLRKVLFVLEEGVDVPIVIGQTRHEVPDQIDPEVFRLWEIAEATTDSPECAEISVRLPRRTRAHHHCGPPAVLPPSLLYILSFQPLANFIGKQPQEHPTLGTQ